MTPAEGTFRLLQLAISFLVYVVTVRCDHVNTIFFYIASFGIKQRSRKEPVAHLNPEL
jgi:hypothetical protein